MGGLVGGGGLFSNGAEKIDQRHGSNQRHMNKLSDYIKDSSDKYKKSGQAFSRVQKKSIDIV